MLKTASVVVVFALMVGCAASMGPVKHTELVLDASKSTYDSIYPAAKQALTFLANKPRLNGPDGRPVYTQAESNELNGLIRLIDSLAAYRYAHEIFRSRARAAGDSLTMGKWNITQYEKDLEPMIADLSVTQRVCIDYALSLRLNFNATRIK